MVHIGMYGSKEYTTQRMRERSDGHDASRPNMIGNGSPDVQAIRLRYGASKRLLSVHLETCPSKYVLSYELLDSDFVRRLLGEVKLSVVEVVPDQLRSSQPRVTKPSRLQSRQDRQLAECLLGSVLLQS